MREHKKPVFTARHYCTIAQRVKHLAPNYREEKLFSVEDIVDSLCCLFKSDNPKFKPELFRKACKVEP